MKLKKKGDKNMEDFKKERTRLVRQFTRLVEKSTNNNDEIVLCEDGKETDNTYPFIKQTLKH